MPVLNGKGEQKLDDKGRPEFISASKWLDQNRPVSQMTWAPGEPLIIIVERLISHGGWIVRPEACLNVYLPPTIVPGKAAEASPWLEHAVEHRHRREPRLGKFQILVPIPAINGAGGDLVAFSD